MAYRNTRSHDYTESNATPAAGLHYAGTRKTVMFEELLDVGDNSMILIGRTEACDIRLRDTSVSLEHATIARREDGLWELEDLDSHNGTVIDRGRAGRGPIRLYASMCIRIGRTRFYGVDERGMVPITACTIDEFCYKLRMIYGTSAEAERRLEGKHNGEEVGREFIRVRALDWENRTR